MTIVSRAAYAQATSGGGLSLVLYDVTTLHFEAEYKDEFRKVGKVKERRVDPQIVVGLLVTPTGPSTSPGTRPCSATVTPSNRCRSWVSVKGVGGNARQRRGRLPLLSNRARRDNHTLAKQIERAEKTVDGRRPLKRDRFVKLVGTRRDVNWDHIDRAKQLAGLKGYVTNIPEIRINGHGIVAAYHELFQVERSFPMARTDLRARPMFHHQHDSIQAHLTIVFTSLAVSRHLQEVTGVGIRKLVRTLRPLRDVTIRIAGTELTATIPPDSDG